MLLSKHLFCLKDAFDAGRFVDFRGVKISSYMVYSCVSILSIILSWYFLGSWAAFVDIIKKEKATVNPIPYLSIQYMI